MKKSYKELFTKYKEGAATVEERLQVEEELERFEALSQYLEDEFRDTDVEEETGEPVNKEALAVEKLVKKRLREVMLKGALISLLLLGLIFYGLSPLVSTLYYNPMNESLSSVEKDVSLDLAVLSELTMPEYASSSVYVEAKGFGSYQMRYSITDLFYQNSIVTEKKIVRGSVVETLNSLYDREPLFITPLEIMREEKESRKQREDIIELLSGLGSTNYGSVSVLFKNSLSMEELREFQTRYENIRLQWVAVENGQGVQTSSLVTGFSPLGSRRSAHLFSDETLLKEYPGLHLLDWLVHQGERSEDGASLEAEGYEKHYEALLYYALDRKSEISVHSERLKETEVLEESAAYVEEHGVRTYGVLLDGTVEDLLVLLEDEAVEWMEIKEMKVLGP
ncbi:anti sigma factor C-terminal domain-containing protein [Proteiniclasticum sp.]|uniref:anti sigma factor C-terminal domain-containing protein n=1 Tax=Proteiniclasticum sp. TaxID=2053595 RepID=UPI00289B5F9F|nr:anti sigma factor C-terminal domain-containing protein [Proteiniclasticum sp.]